MRRPITLFGSILSWMLRRLKCWHGWIVKWNLTIQKWARKLGEYLQDSQRFPYLKKGNK
jgi:hypothetical protein